MSIGVARVDLDVANGLLQTGANTVFVNDKPAAFLTTVDAGGFDVVASSTTVIAEDKGIAREADPMSNGVLIASASTDVFAN